MTEELIYGWMKNLAFFFIFMTAVLNCLPDNRYRKYVRFFLGMLVIIILARPLTEFLHLDEILEGCVSRGMLETEGGEDWGTGLGWRACRRNICFRGMKRRLRTRCVRFLREDGELPPVETCG